MLKLSSSKSINSANIKLIFMRSDKGLLDLYCSDILTKQGRGPSSVTQFLRGKNILKKKTNSFIPKYLNRVKLAFSSSVKLGGVYQNLHNMFMSRRTIIRLTKIVGSRRSEDPKLKIVYPAIHQIIRAANSSYMFVLLPNKFKLLYFFITYMVKWAYSAPSVKELRERSPTGSLFHLQT